MKMQLTVSDEADCRHFKLPCKLHHHMMRAQILIRLIQLEAGELTIISSFFLNCSVDVRASDAQILVSL